MTEATEPTQLTLTRDDLAALRSASSVCFTTRDGASSIKAFLLNDGDKMRPARFVAAQKRVFPLMDPGFGTHDRCRVMPCSASAYGYGGNDQDWSSGNSPRLECFTMLSTARQHRTWSTIATLLRVGDTLHLHWEADNNNEALVAAGLHQDELLLVVTRGLDVLRFSVDVRVGEDTVARMIHRFGDPAARPA